MIYTTIIVNKETLYQSSGKMEMFSKLSLKCVNRDK